MIYNVIGSFLQSSQGQIQDSPKGTPIFQEGAPTYDFTKFPPKMYDIKKILEGEVGSPV